MTRPNLISAKSLSFVVIMIIIVEGETLIVHFTINEKSIYFDNKMVIICHLVASSACDFSYNVVYFMINCTAHNNQAYY